MKYFATYTFHSLTLGTTANKKTSIITPANPEVLHNSLFLEAFLGFGTYLY
jgi:hypothetical protein